jgi:adenosylcobinamide-GDP ribazoletransferase
MRLLRDRVEGVRLALGLLTVLPVGRVRTDRRTARDAVLAAPAVGVLLGALAWAVGAAAHAAGGGSLLAAVAAVATLAVASRALHLDGLADLADGLGSARPAEGALAVMRRSDIGPFGVVTLVLVLLGQVAALTAAWQEGHAAAPLLVAGASSRLALVWACRPAVPAARTDGAATLVAGTVPTAAAAGATATLLVLCAAAALPAGPRTALACGAGMLVGLGAALLLLRRAVARLRGVTGDVLGAMIETAATAALMTTVLVLGAGG